MNKVQHFELPADDMGRAKEFYSKVFGWKIVDFPMPDMEYAGAYTTEVDDKHMPKEVAAINGGIVKRGGALPLTGPTVAIVVADLDAKLLEVKGAGGSIVMDKKEIGEMGYYAYIKDTEGNLMGVWQDKAKSL